MAFHFKFHRMDFLNANKIQCSCYAVTSVSISKKYNKHIQSHGKQLNTYVQTQINFIEMNAMSYTDQNICIISE